MTRAVAVSMWRKSPRKRVARDRRQHAGELDAGRSAADDDEGQIRRAIRLASVALSARSNAARTAAANLDARRRCS